MIRREHDDLHNRVPPCIGKWVPILGFCTILLDGFDTTSIGVVVPTMSRIWGVLLPAFTPAFVMTSIGAVLGYVASGRIAVRVGRRSLILGSVLAFAVGACATMLVTTVAQLAAIRLFTGLGLGAAIPACVSLAVECTTEKHREVMTVAVTSGLTIGATLAGALGGRLIAHFGWQSVFGIGGMLPLLLLPLLWLGVPTGESDAMVTTGRTSPAASVSSLLEGDLKRHTALLWSFSFLVFMPLYALTFWIPTLLLSFGFDSVSVSLGSAALSGGGFIASLLLVPATAWLGVRRVLIGISCAAVLVSVALSRLTLESMQVLAALGLLGGCLVAGAIGQTALAVSLYPAALRTAGVGWSDAVGRTGSIVGPAAFGALLSIGKTPRDVLLALCAPLGLAVLVAIAAARLHDNRADVALKR